MEINTNYLKALDYLYSFVDHSLTRAFRYSPDKFDLGRMAVFLESLGNPHLKFPVIHLAGSKGKGSTAAMIASALRAGGYQVGFYTSPHLQEYTERIQVNGVPIPQEEFVRLVDEIKPYVEKIKHLSTFEITTGLAFQYFASQDVNAAVIEVGLGGRLDATNLVDPLVSVITSLSYEHMEILGHSLGQIATEKAGIIKPGRPVVLAPQKDEAKKVVEQIAFERNAPLTLIGRDYFYTPWSHTLDGQTLFVWRDEEQPLMDGYLEGDTTGTWEPMKLFIPLLGQHQVENAACALAALQISRKEGLLLSDEDIQEGLSNVFWPGRFEVLRRMPPVIVDSAHNQDSASKLRMAIDDYLPGVPVILLFGASEDKDISGIFSELLPRVSRVIATESYHPRALSAKKLVELAHQFGRPAQICLPIENALQKALDLAGDEAAVVAAGSVFIAGAIRECWQKSGQPMRTFDDHS